MQQSGGKDSKRHFTVVMGGKEHGLYISSTPSSAARKAVTKLCAANKSKKVDFHIREITQGSKKKTYGPYSGYIEKLKEPIELKGRVIKYKPVAKLSAKKGVQKGGTHIYAICDTITQNIEKGSTYATSAKETLEQNQAINQHIENIMVRDNGLTITLKEDKHNKLNYLKTIVSGLPGCRIPNN